jgi:trans-aconitate methyltransferase
VGCGNGRNYARLVERGLDLIGLDVSVAAIQQLADRLPDRRTRLIVGEIAALRPEPTFRSSSGYRSSSTEAPRRHRLISGVRRRW